MYNNFTEKYLKLIVYIIKYIFNKILEQFIYYICIYLKEERIAFTFTWRKRKEKRKLEKRKWRQNLKYNPIQSNKFAERKKNRFILKDTLY